VRARCIRGFPLETEALIECVVGIMKAVEEQVQELVGEALKLQRGYSNPG
jgi:hypothetical protein